MEGHNLLGIAQSGTGKTGAFLIPIIHNMIRDASSLKGKKEKLTSRGNTRMIPVMKE